MASNGVFVRELGLGRTLGKCFLVGKTSGILTGNLAICSRFCNRQAKRESPIVIYTTISTISLRLVIICRILVGSLIFNASICSSND